MDEIWRDIEGYKGLYQVSDQGRIRSLDRIVAHSRYGYKTLKGRLLRPTKNGDGYFYINLYKDNHEKKYKTHRLVAQAFIPNPENKEEVDHINTKRDDNRVENLRWATKLENNRNSLTRKKRSENNPMRGKYGKDNPNSKSIYQISKDGNLIRKWEGIKEAARNTEVYPGNIVKCCQGKLNASGGYRWIYASELDNFLNKKMMNNIQKKRTA